MLPDDSTFSKNILAGIVAIVVSTAISIGYCVLTHTAATSEVVVYAICLIALTWLCAMLGYDKVIQTLTQIKGNKEEDQK